MSNQVLLWSIFILPWITIFFIKKEDIKRFAAVALFAVIFSIIIAQVGERLNWWVIQEPLYPFPVLPHALSLDPVMTIWIFLFTYGRFWLFLATEIVANLIFPYLFLGYFMRVRNIFEFTGLGPIHVFLFTTTAGILLYCYQMWQEGIFAQPYRRS